MSTTIDTRHLTYEQLDRFLERAAICEYDGKMTREQAEKIAYREVTACR